jgi:hypothetical protein
MLFSKIRNLYCTPIGRTVFQHVVEYSEWSINIKYADR